MPGLRISYVFGIPLGIGGHFRSALAMIRNLQAMGQNILVLAPGGETEMLQAYTETGAEVQEIPELEPYRTWPATGGAQTVRRLTRAWSADVIHAQDLRGLGRAYLAASLEHAPLVFTQAGGPFRMYRFPPHVHTVVYSQELKDGLRQVYHLDEADLHVIRARIDRGVYRPQEVNHAFVQAHGLPALGRKVAMAMRLHSTKTPWLQALMAAAATLAQQTQDVHFVIAGDGPLLKDLRSQALQINQRSRSGPVLHFMGPLHGLEAMNQFHNYADVVVGHGRGILEAMACRKPVVVLGEEGQGEIVRPENIARIARFNFSGRHFREDSAPAKPLHELLQSLLADEAARKSLGDLSYAYIAAEMDARIGAQQLLDVYSQALMRKASLLNYAVWYARAFLDRTQHALSRRLRPGQAAAAAEPDSI